MQAHTHRVFALSRDCDARLLFNVGIGISRVPQIEKIIGADKCGNWKINFKSILLNKIIFCIFIFFKLIPGSGSIKMKSNLGILLEIYEV